ncbi:hypothetical protein I79_023070 [Cricetulus griseus]|uniref:Uncharacterized protein n=1 Tax=Cricetulus griseus TaxID=10029 RepID=G3IGZ3_CRIGR|nr:hypothetical protein I79_023070 [Cricetulus griseus]
MPLLHSVKESQAAASPGLYPHIMCLLSATTHLCCCLHRLCHHLVLREEQTFRDKLGMERSPLGRQVPQFLVPR